MAEIDKGLPNTRNKEEIPSQDEIQDVAVQEPVGGDMVQNFMDYKASRKDWEQSYTKV